MCLFRCLFFSEKMREVRAIRIIREDRERLKRRDKTKEDRTGCTESDTGEGAAGNTGGELEIGYNAEEPRNRTTIGEQGGNCS